MFEGRQCSGALEPSACKRVWELLPRSAAAIGAAIVILNAQEGVDLGSAASGYLGCKADEPFANYGTLIRLRRVAPHSEAWANVRKFHLHTELRCCGSGVGLRLLPGSKLP